MKELQHLLNKLNKVTAYHRHGHKIPVSALDNLSNAQIEYEKAIQVEAKVKPANGGSREDKIMELLQDFWDEHNNNKAVVWNRNDNTGQLAIYTRGEYAKDLIQFISRLSV